MSLKKSIISTFLLLAYFIGLAHDIVPHSHDSSVCEEYATHEHHKGHEHDVSEEVEHVDISHSDHLDHGLLDLLTCLFSESDHSSVDNILCYTGEDVKVNFTVFYSVLEFYKLTFSLAQKTEPVFEHTFPESIPIALSPLRGPPQHSC